MDEKGFLNYLKDTNRSELTIRNSMNSIKMFSNFLSAYNATIASAKLIHLRDFLVENRNEKRIRMHFGAIGVYYQFLGNTYMNNLAREIGGELLLENYKLKKFLLVNLAYLSKLEEIGIKTAKQMLDAGLTRVNRKNLAKQTTVPEDYILELVKLSNLARIPGLKKTRARLYYEAGIDTLVELAHWNPKDLKNHLDDYAEKTEIAKMGVLLAEATSAISLAKHLPKIVEF